jgi:hypothetical protein
MKAFYTLSVVALATVFFQSAYAQVVEDVVSAGAGQVNMVHYSLSEGEVSSHALASWDIGFDVTFFGVGVRVNTAKGIQVAKYPGSIEDWDVVDTTGFAGWEKLFDSAETWDDGALNSGSEGFDVGWGAYSTITHTTAGHSIFILKYTNGTCVKLRIDSNASGNYYFTYANIDDEESEVSETFAKANYPGKNYAYYSLLTEEALDLEPTSATWDLVFGRYSDLYGTAGFQTVSGVRSNKHVKVARVDDTAPASVVLGDVQADDFLTEINTIGDGWKYLDYMATPPWQIVANRTYIVKTATEYYKLIFTGFGGSTTGDYSFTKEYLADVVGIAENVNGSGFFLYPNPINNDGSSLQMVVETYKAENLQIQISDLQGRVVKTLNQPVSGQLQTLNLDIAGMQSGLYNVSILSSTGVATQKLVVR